MERRTSEQMENIHHNCRLAFDDMLDKEIEEKRSRGEIPSNEQIIAMIPSKAVREYLVKIGHVFSERDCELLRRYLAPKNEDEFDSLYSKGRYVSIPYPFRRGDIVVAYGVSSMMASKAHDGEYSIGIMRSFTDDKDWHEWDTEVKERLIDFCDFSDVSTAVEFLQDDGSFSHEHPNPLALEFASDVQGALPKDTLRTKHLEACAELLTGKGSLELYEMYKQSYAASPEHLIELLHKVYGHLRDYAETFDSYKKLYFPTDNGMVHKLSYEQQKEAYSLIQGMEFDALLMSSNLIDLVLPLQALSDSNKQGVFHEAITDAQNKDAVDSVTLIFDEAAHILQRIENFVAMPDAPRHQLYQKKVEKSIHKLKSLITAHLKGVKPI
ncbi:MAG: hypothetical protein K6E51_08765 [Treponema sp.]|nr:hypothetical protein [Treponema sp.]